MVYYQNAVAVFTIDPVELLDGELARKQLRLIEAWAELHEEELKECWQLLQEGKRPFKINPLQ